MMLDKRIKFMEKTEDNGITFLYYIAPAELFGGVYGKNPIQICIEYPDSNTDLSGATISISPIENGDCYDWREIILPHDEVKALIEKHREAING